ncbi:p53-like transcription factor [Hesseltinella vesiculosa]|uniref:p53-like transcription factor n=1 Tax=Hesseltinella vesiculosa TaxID=101127 RepID=A0A1X2GFZ0_9FUNG|nr:p53-like transcription factor [Hesseltinella vesiculosa]
MSNSCQLEIKCKMDRGFFLCQEQWTCYRRNYFQLTTAFNINSEKHWDGQGLPSYFIQTPDQPMPIRQFLVRLQAHASDAGSPGLIQMTPKRDKGPQSAPGVIPIQPGGMPYQHHPPSSSPIPSTSTASPPPPAFPHQLVTFERLQFKAATANNGKKRATQQYFYLTVQLLADTMDQSQHLIASSKSSPLVVRGRSPGHYTPSPSSSSPPIHPCPKKPSPRKKKQRPAEHAISPPMHPPQMPSTPIPSISPRPPQQDPFALSMIHRTPVVPSNSMYGFPPHTRSFSANDSPHTQQPIISWHGMMWADRHRTESATYPSSSSSPIPPSSSPLDFDKSFVLYPSSPWDLRGATTNTSIDDSTLQPGPSS